MALGVVIPTPLVETPGEFIAAQTETAESAAMPQLHDQAVEQRLARKALCTIGQTSVKDGGEDFGRIVEGADFFARLGFLHTFRLVEGKNHLSRKDTGGIFLLVHGPNYVASLCDRGPQIRPAFARRLQNGG